MTFGDGCGACKLWRGTRRSWVSDPTLADGDWISNRDKNSRTGLQAAARMLFIERHSPQFQCEALTAVQTSPIAIWSFAKLQAWKTGRQGAGRDADETANAQEREEAKGCGNPECKCGNSPADTEEPCAANH